MAYFFLPPWAARSLSAAGSAHALVAATAGLLIRLSVAGSSEGTSGLRGWTACLLLRACCGLLTIGCGCTWCCCRTRRGPLTVSSVSSSIRGAVGRTGVASCGTLHVVCGSGTCVGTLRVVSCAYASCSGPIPLAGTCVRGISGAICCCAPAAPRSIWPAFAPPLLAPPW